MVTSIWSLLLSKDVVLVVVDKDMYIEKYVALFNDQEV